MPYGKIAGAVLGLILIVGRSIYQETDGYHYKKKRRYKTEEAPAKKTRKRQTRHRRRTSHSRRISVAHRWAYGETHDTVRCCAVVLTYCTFQASREQAQDGHTNLVLSEAAFIYGNPPKAENAAGQSPPSVLFLVPIGNSGSTQTRGLQYQIACTPAADFSQIDITHPEGRSVSEKLLLAPKAEISPVGCQIPYTALANIKTKGEALFIFGHATYFDVVTRTKRHETQFCYMEKLADVQASTFDGFATACPSYNCADDECTDYTGR